MKCNSLGNKTRDARIYRRVSNYVANDLRLKPYSTDFRSPLIDMLYTARDAMALNTASPA